MTNEELFNKLMYCDKDHGYSISEENAYYINFCGYIGVAILNSLNVEIDETFNNVYIRSLTLNINNTNNNYIVLYTEKTYLTIQFVHLCNDFIDLDYRNERTNNPFEWYKSWCEIMGNSFKQRMVYDFIGEMKTLLILLKANKHPTWNSINLNTYDITADDGIYEVKSTKTKSANIVKINNENQLNPIGLDRKLFLTLVKVEENEAGESIDDLYDQLVENGYDRQSLDEYLDKNGFAEGRFDRTKKFQIKEIRAYEVNEHFPRLTRDSFKNDTLPQGVIAFTYDISLDGLPYVHLMEE